MMQPSRLFFLSALLGFLSLSNAYSEQYRYSYIESTRITGEREDMKTESVEECGFLAYNEHAFAFSHLINASGEFCGLLISFSAMEAIQTNETTAEHYYLRDRRNIPVHQCDGILTSGEYFRRKVNVKYV
uniref:Competence protein n=1 Tax=Steinernema glaseri TaxID=37863 RepID=A0A1I7YXR5_9BILA